MKALLMAMLIPAMSALADTTYIQQNIPGTPLVSDSRPGLAIQRLGGRTEVYTTLPGSAHLRSATGPSYTIINPPDLSDLDMRKSIERLGRGEE